MKTAILVAVSLLSIPACQLVVGFESFNTNPVAGSSGSAGASTGGSAGSAGGSGSAGDSGIVCNTVPGIPGRGPAMKQVTSAATCRWIDETEVTINHYAAFLQSNPSATTQDSACVNWNTSFDPDATCLADPSYVISTDPAHPQVCIDQCDAAAFCEWAGKKLCKSLFSGSPDPSVETWYVACSGNQTRGFPYGSSYDAQACNDLDKVGNGCPSSCTTFAAGSLLTCKTPDDGVADLAGNVAEWGDACDATNGVTDHCMTFGGWFANDDPACDTRNPFLRNDVFPYVGFRCCGE